MRPFKSDTCNQAQLCCLAALSLMYFSGLCLKARIVDRADTEKLGYGLVSNLVLAVGIVLFALGRQTVTIIRGVGMARVSYFASLLFSRTN